MIQTFQNERDRKFRAYLFQGKVVDDIERALEVQASVKLGSNQPYPSGSNF